MLPSKIQLETFFLLRTFLAKVVISIFWPLLTLAEPSGATKYLLREPVSLMDMGIYRLRESLKKENHVNALQSGIDLSALNLEVDYDLQVDRLIIRGLESLRGSNSKDETKNRCRAVINGLRSFFGIDPATGKVSKISKKLGFENSNLAGYYFSPDSGYTFNAQPKNFESDLDTKTLLRFHVQSQDAHGVINFFRCEGPLLSTDILFSE